MIWGSSDEAFRSAHQAFYKMAERQPTLHSDDFYSELQELGISLPPGVVGRIWKTAVDNGIIEFSGEMRKSVRPQAHRRRMPVWKSKLFKEPSPQMARWKEALIVGIVLVILASIFLIKTS